MVWVELPLYSWYSSPQCHNHIQPEKPKEAEVYGTAKERKIRKHDEALERQASRQNRTDAEQLALLESRGHGHCGEAIELRIKLGVK